MTFFIHDLHEPGTTSDLSSDFYRANQLSFQWKMRFNPDPIK